MAVDGLEPRGQVCGKSKRREQQSFRREEGYQRPAIREPVRHGRCAHQRGQDDPTRACVLAGDDSFRAEMETLCNSEPAGVFKLPWIWDMEARIEKLEEQGAELLSRLG